VLGYIEQSQGFKIQHVPAKISDVAIMIEKGEVEAFIGWEPASAAAVAQAPNLLHYIQRLPPIPNAESLELAFRPSYIKDHPDLVGKICPRYAQGHYMDQNEWAREDSPFDRGKK